MFGQHFASSVKKQQSCKHHWYTQTGLFVSRCDAGALMLRTRRLQTRMPPHPRPHCLHQLRSPASDCVIKRRFFAETVCVHWQRVSVRAVHASSRTGRIGTKCASDPPAHARGGKRGKKTKQRLSVLNQKPRVTPGSGCSAAACARVLLQKDSRRFFVSRLAKASTFKR